MKCLPEMALKISKLLHAISGVALVWMMLLTVADVIMRKLGRPITGSYELVTFSTTVVIGFGLPYTTWTRGHVYMEFFIQKMPKKRQTIANIFTRLISIALFALAGYNLFVIGFDLYKTKEVTDTLNFPYYPFVYGLGMCCFMLCLILLCDILKIYGSYYEQ